MVRQEAGVFVGGGGGVGGGAFPCLAVSLQVATKYNVAALRRLRTLAEASDRELIGNVMNRRPLIMVVRARRRRQARQRCVSPGWSRRPQSKQEGRIHL